MSTQAEPSRSPTRKIWAALGIGWIFLVLIWLVLELTPQRFERTFTPAEIRADGGHRYTAPLHQHAAQRFFLPLRSDTLNASPSELVLAENGSPLGPAHALHAGIQAQGEGRYSHWSESLVFSTSDNSDPRTNGRTYAASSPLHPALWLRLAGVLGLIAGAVLALERMFPGMRANLMSKLTSRLPSRKT